MIFSSFIAAAVLTLARGEDFVDCVGQKLTDEDCVWKAGGYEKCSDWIGDDSCDDGLVITDNWTQMYLNCAKFEYDGGDCEKDADQSIGVCSDELEEGECKAPDDDEIVDCWGQVITDKDCMFEYTDDDGKKHTYEKCEDWVGDGVCDAGQFISEEGVHLNFNCKAFNFDGGDCDGPKEDTDTPTTRQPTTDTPTTLQPTREPTANPTQEPTANPTPAPAEDTRAPTTRQPTKKDNQGEMPIKSDMDAMDAIWESHKMMKIVDKRYYKIKWNGCYDEDGNDPINFISHYMADGQKDAGFAFAKCAVFDGDLRVTELHIKSFGSNYKKWKGKGLLQKLKHLSLININGNQLKKFKAEFKEMPNLKVIEFSENVVRKLDKAWLEGSPNVEEIYMDGNKMRGLKDGTFQNLGKLKHLDIAGNGCKKISDKMFIDNVSLEFLNLSDNKWSKVKEDTFATLKSLKVLEIEDNSFKTLPTKLFLKLGSIEEIKLNGNRLKCQPPLPNDRKHKPHKWSEDGAFAMDNADKLDECDFEMCSKLKDSGKKDFCKNLKNNDWCEDADGECDATCVCCDMDGPKVCKAMTNEGRECDSAVMSHIYAGVCKKTCGYC